MIFCLNLVLILLCLVLAVVLGHRDTGEELDSLKERIKELNEKSTQLLIFLSFAIAAVVFLGYANASNSVSQRITQTGVLRWWVIAIFPVIFGVLPLKEFGRNKSGWYRLLVWLKVCLLWAAILDIVVGAVIFFRAL